MNRWLERSLIAVVAAALGAVGLHFATLQALARVERELRAGVGTVSRAEPVDLDRVERLLVRLERQHAVLDGALLADLRGGLGRALERVVLATLDGERGFIDEARHMRAMSLLQHPGFGFDSRAETIKASAEGRRLEGISRCIGGAQGRDQYVGLADCPFADAAHRARAREALQATRDPR